MLSSLSMNRFIIIKAGTTFPNTARQYGDFDEWTRLGLGLSPDQVDVFDVMGSEVLPSAKDCEGVVVTGSHAMVTDKCDWSEQLVAWIAELLRAKVPFLGICYGHQLLTKAAGGTVGYHPLGQELGTVDVNLLPEHLSDALFKDFPPTFFAHVTHSQSVLDLPSHAIRLAENSFEKNHAIRVGDCAWGVQFHPEYSAGLMRSYIEEQAGEIQASGRSMADILQTVKDTPDAASVLRRFAAFCEQKKVLKASER
jgi:GMP synthase (glutamine-hydrolysing)